MVRIGLGIALVALASGASAQMTPVPLLPGETLLSVQATGESSAVPDTGAMNFGMVSTGTTAREATDANAAAMTAVVAAIRKSGVEARSIRTQQIDVQPRFASNSSGEFREQLQIIGYVARNSVVVTLTKLGIASDVIAAAFGAGANSANGPNLRLQDNRPALAEARRDALVKARTEADLYAEGLGLKIGRVLRVSERSYSDASPRIQYAAPPQYQTLPPFSSGEVVQKVDLSIEYTLTAK